MESKNDLTPAMRRIVELEVASMLQSWIKCSARLPEPAEPVLVIFETGYRCKKQIALVKYVPSKTIKAEDFWDSSGDCCTDYDETTDCHYIEEGWYEHSYESETYWKLTCKVTHWMPLPPLVKGNTNETKGA